MDYSGDTSLHAPGRRFKNKSASKAKYKYSSNKSPFGARKKLKKKKQRNKSKTIVKPFPAKNDSFGHFGNHALGGGAKSSRQIPFRSKTPTLRRLKSPNPGPARPPKLTRISESKWGQPEPEFGEAYAEKVNIEVAMIEFDQK